METTRLDTTTVVVTLITSLASIVIALYTAAKPKKSTPMNGVSEDLFQLIDLYANRIEEQSARIEELEKLLDNERTKRRMLEFENDHLDRKIKELQEKLDKLHEKVDNIVKEK